MKATQWLRVCLLVFLGLLATGAAAFGQTNGTIQGTINDPSGASIPNATVTAVMTGTAATRTVTSGADGNFEFDEFVGLKR